jgi:predicted metal-binding protein
VSLKANGVEVSKKTVTAENGWKYSFTDLPKFSDGKEISYTIAEETVKDYSTQINGYNLTNSYTPGKTSITVTKSWDDEENQDGIRPESIKVQLSANGTAYGETVVLNADNKWSYTWSDLDEKKSGKDIDYTVAETSNISGYTSAISGTAASGFTITNTHKTEVTEVSVAKTWSDNENQDGKRPESVSVQLYANGSASGKAVVLNAENNWGHTWTDLVKKNAGADVVYTVQEVETPEGYTSAVSGTAADGYTITNTHETATTSVSGTKTWDDSSNQDGIRPDSITVNLLADGTKADSTKVTSENGWKYSFANLPVYKDGKKVVYTVSEENVEGYTSTIDGSNITNTHKTEETEVSVTKGLERWK